MHNRKQIRLQGFDYSSNRYYFITINVRNHSCTFGAIGDSHMKLSANGIIALEQWQWLGNQYPYINLLSFVVMPDHVHGIIQINPNCVRQGRDPALHDPTSYNVRQGRDPALHKIKPLHELIGAYKTTVSKRIHLAGDPWFRWHNSYHDHIIRNELELTRITRYIEDNPANWDCREGTRPFPT